MLSTQLLSLHRFQIIEGWIKELVEFSISDMKNIAFQYDKSAIASKELTAVKENIEKIAKNIKFGRDIENE